MVSNYYDNLPPITEMLEKFDLSPKKSLGQNFLLNFQITDKIARSLPDIKNCVVVEIGAGPAGLTRALLKNKVKKVIAVEFDKRAVALLKDVQKEYPNLHIINDDALKIDYEDIKKQYCDDGEKFCIVSNLPYNISVPLLVKWLHLIHKDNNFLQNMLLMFQKEVGLRIVSESGNKSFGRISILAQYLTKIRKVLDLPKGAFTPAPKVDSAVLLFDIKKTDGKDKIDLNKLEEVVKACFANRRKILKKNIEKLIEKYNCKNPEMMEKYFSLRAEQLSVEDFIFISKNL